MAGFKLIDYYIAGDYKTGLTRKCSVTSASNIIAIGDIVSYTGNYTGQIREVDRAVLADSTTNPHLIAGIVVGFTSLDTPLSNQSGLLSGESGFVLVNTGVDMVYAGELDTAITFTSNVVGSNIGFNATVSASTNGIVESGMQFTAGTIDEGTLPFRIEGLNNDDPTAATICYGRLQLSELNSNTGLTPAA